jgi:hypothetical protein
MHADAETVAILGTSEVRRYLDRTVRVWLGLPPSAEAPALPNPLARLLLRLEEHETGERDRWGRWDFDLSESYRNGRLWVAEIDEWVADRRRELSATNDLEPLWPGQRPFAVCLTHDVDLLSVRSTPRQVLRHARAGLERDGTIRRFARPPARVARSLRAGIARAPATHDTIERSVELEAARGLTASYLFTPPPGRDASRFDCVYALDDPCRFRGARRSVAEVMRTLADEGFDVGLHGSYHAGLRPGALRRERDVLERATGLTIETTRQHLLHWDVRSTPALQEQAGFRVDSSLAFNRNVGFRAGTSLPFRLFDVAGGAQLQLLEVPPVLQDVSLLDAWGLGLELDRAREVVAEFVAIAAAAGTAITLVFHPDKLAQPRWLELYEWTLDEVVERGAWVTSLRGLEEWWRLREDRVLA